MKLVHIRTRMLLTALLPVTLLAVLLTVVFLVVRVGDMDEAYRQRARSLARQLAAASEYGLFSANVIQLQIIASGALREADVHSVAILDAHGQILVRAGKPGYTTVPALSGQESEWLDPGQGLDLWTQPVRTSRLKLDDLYEAWTIDAGGSPMVGHVLVEFSRATLVRREREMLLLGLAVSLAGVLFGGFLAVHLGRGVTHHILRVSRMLERIGRGELSARGEVLPEDPLRDLQQGLNQMAERLESRRDELEQRIAMATLALREKKEEAEAATLAKSRFLAAASHDLRQPTHALGMFMARLAQLPHDAETGHLISNLGASVRALQDLLDGLLDISRLDAQTVPVQLRHFALAELLEQLRAGSTLAAAQKGLRLRVRATTTWVMSDFALLHRIMLNLVSNAVRYTPAGGVLVACRLVGCGQRVRIEVWDSGIGIAPEHRQVIFQEFFQVGNVERDRVKGLGLGLNIVERTAQLLGHPLQLCSRPGRGSRFSIEVPVAPPGTTGGKTGLPEPKAWDELAGLVVLAIEDDPLVREGLVSLLRSWECSVRVADGLTAALWQLEQGPVPDLIVSDYRLRGGDNGIETIRQLRRAAGRSIPACLVSGDMDPGLMQLSQRAGLVLLHKPVRPAKLRSLLRRLATEGAAERGAADGLVVPALQVGATSLV